MSTNIPVRKRDDKIKHRVRLLQQFNDSWLRKPLIKPLCEKKPKQ